MALVRRVNGAGNYAPRWPFTLNKDSPQAQGLTLWFPGYPVDSTTLYDLSGLAQHGTLAGPTLAFDEFGAPAVEFDGVDDRVSFTLAAALDCTLPFTLACWARPDALATTDNSLLTANGTNFLWDFNDADSIRLRTAGVATDIETPITAADYLNKLRLLTVVSTGTQYRFFADGQLIGSGSVTPTGSESAFRIGIRDNNAADFDGLIRDMRIWRRALSDAEVWALYDPATRWDLYYELGRRFYSFPAAGGATVTAISSLDAAIQRQNVLAQASMDAAVQRSRTATASLDAALQAAMAATAQLDAALQGERTTSAELDAAVQTARSAQASLDAAVQATLTLAASLDGALQATRTATASLDAFLTGAASTTLTASLDAALQKAMSLVASLDAAIQSSGLTASASLDAALSKAETITALLDAAVMRSLTAEASLDAAVQADRSLSVSLDAKIGAFTPSTKRTTVARAYDGSIIPRRGGKTTTVH